MKDRPDLIVTHPEPVSDMPHLSYSRLNRYLTCPEQYRLHYIEGLRARIPSASLLFGQLVHQALAAFFQSQTAPADFFQANWSETKDGELRFAYRETWDNLFERGQKLLALFVQNEAAKVTGIVACERPFQLSITGLTLPFIGTIDLVAQVEARLTVVDFKTAGAAYADHEVILSDQLTAYHLAAPEARHSALCVLLKTKEPRIDWQFTQRNVGQVAEFLGKLSVIAEAILAEKFYKRPGQWCTRCDFLPICMGVSPRH